MILFHLFLFNPDWLKKKNFSTVIVFYDGSCGICNRFIQFILKHSTHTQFAPLEGSIARRMLTKKQQKNKDSIIVIKDGITYDKSNAILELMHELDGIYPLLYSLKVLPKYFRNFFYEIFAKYRHHIRKQSTCSLLTTDEQKRFLQ
jgi:predicted DCC family thiol-disulfide oxidoreductase YuxK